MLIAAGLRSNLAELFAGMSVVTFMLILVGLMLIVVEFFQPSYGFPTACGSALVLLGITVRMLSGGTLVMLFFMVFFCAVLLLTVHMLMLLTQKRAWLATSLAFTLKRSMQPEEGGYAFLLGQDGVATTDISGSGHMAIDDVNFFVGSETFIPKGTAVRVVRVAGDSIRVMPVYEAAD